MPIDRLPVVICKNSLSDGDLDTDDYSTGGRIVIAPFVRCFNALP